MDRVIERDFLSLHWRDSNEDAMGNRQADLLGNSNLAAKWPLSNNAYNKVVQEERARSHALGKYVLALDPFEANQKTAPKLAGQTYFSPDKQAFSQYPLHSNQPEGSSFADASHHELYEARSFPAFQYHNVPVTKKAHFFKIQNAQDGPRKMVTLHKQQIYPAGGPVAGVFGQRNVPKPTHMSAQLTTFYAGCVNVFDDVTLDKVQAIMSLASKGSNAGSNGVKPRSEAHLPKAAVMPAKNTGANGFKSNKTMILTPNQVVSSCSGHSSSGSGSRTNVNAGCKAVGPLFPTTQRNTSDNPTPNLGSDTAAYDMPKAVPQARKASLARFLEMRKERLSTVMPYSPSTKTRENGSGFESRNGSSISSSTDINLSSNSNREDSLIVAHQKFSRGSEVPPSDLYSKSSGMRINLSGAAQSFA